MKTITAIISTIIASMVVYFWETNSAFVYSHFIDILAGISIFGIIAVLVVFHCRFKNVEDVFRGFNEDAVRSRTMMFCNLLLDKKRIKSADISYLYKLEEDCKKLNINGYVQSNIEQVKGKYEMQEGIKR